MFDRRVKEKGTIHYRVSLPEHWAALIMGMANAIRFIFFPLEQLVYPWSYSLNDAIFLVVTLSHRQV